MSNNNLTLKGKFTEVFKHGLIYGLTSSLQSILGFLMLPILTVYYTPEVFGVYSILLLLSALTSAIFYFGASSSLGRFYFEEESEIYRKKIFTTAFLVTLIGAILLIFLAFIFSNQLSIELFHSKKYSNPIILILIATSLGFLLNLMTLLLRYEKKSEIFLITTLGGVIINFSITYILLSKFNYGLLSPILGLLFSNAICFFFLFFLRINSITIKIDIQHVKMIVNFGILSSITGLLFYLLDWVDRIILKDLLNLKEVGIYSLGYRLGSIMNILVIMPFSLVWGPYRMKNSKNSDSLDFTSKILSYYTLIGVLVMSGTILFGENLIHYFFKNNDYKASFSILPIIMFSQFFFGYQNIVDYGLYLHKKNSLYILVSIISIILNIKLNYWLIPIFGIIGAAFVTLLTYIFSSTLIFLLSNRYVIIEIEKFRIFSALSIVPILYSLFKFSFLNNFFVKIILVLILLILFYRHWLNKSERTFIKKTLIGTKIH